MPSSILSPHDKIEVVVQEIAPKSHVLVPNQAPRSSLGVLNDSKLQDVPGSVILFAEVAEADVVDAVVESALESEPKHTTHLPLPLEPLERQLLEKKRTKDGKIILEPQPEDTRNDPLNWPSWRRDCALFSLGIYCMLGGGLTPIMAAGFNDIAKTFDVTIPQVALTTGLYMLGLGIGCVFVSPTALVYGKRPVYLSASILLIVSCIWCATSTSFMSLLIGRIVQGIAVSSVEALPSSTITEIYCLHERAFRLGVYTLLLLGGKNLVPLVSAAVIGKMGWRWVFWIVAMVAGFCAVILFFFVHETFWDRSSKSHAHLEVVDTRTEPYPFDRKTEKPSAEHIERIERIEQISRMGDTHAQFRQLAALDPSVLEGRPSEQVTITTQMIESELPSPRNGMAKQGNEPYNANNERPVVLPTNVSAITYTERQRLLPPRSFVQCLAPTNGRITNNSWGRAAVRPFILFAYPAILWSALIYAMSIGWLVVMSETVAAVYRSKELYNFTALQTGMVYISPFIGGVLGTAIAGKLSDLIVRFMAKRNGGLYEPEFRLVMVIPVALATSIGLMGFGWSTGIHDRWIIPTFFFGVISFGCALGSTTAITFAVDSYKQFAGEALVTLNFSKNIFHGLAFSLFFNHWLEHDGSKKVFLAIGFIQLACCSLTIPMYIFGKRARAWTVRKAMMDRF